MQEDIRNKGNFVFGPLLNCGMHTDKKKFITMINNIIRPRV